MREEISEGGTKFLYVMKLVLHIYCVFRHGVFGLAKANNVLHGWSPLAEIDRREPRHEV